MPTTSAQPATTPIPVQLSAAASRQDILLHLSMPKRGPQYTLGYHRVFNLIVWGLYTGMQWKCFPVRKDRDGTATIHELAASFQESRRGIPWLWWRPRVADEGAVRKMRGTLGQRVRHNAQNRCPCARVLQRCPGYLCIHVLLIFHEVSPVSKPCNPFTGSAHRKAFPRSGCRLDHGWRR